MTDDASPAPQTPSDTTGTGDQANAGLPTIRADDGDLAHLTDNCPGALRHGHADVSIYRHAGRLIRVESDAGGRPQIEYLTAVQIRHHLARNAQFGRRYVTHSGQILEVNRAGTGTGNMSGAQSWALSEPGSSIPATTDVEAAMPS